MCWVVENLANSTRVSHEQEVVVLGMQLEIDLLGVRRSPERLDRLRDERKQRDGMRAEGLEASARHRLDRMS